MISCIVKLPYATFGIRVEEGKVIKAPPIAKWMVGKTVLEVRAWVKGKKGTVDII